METIKEEVVTEPVSIQKSPKNKKSFAVRLKQGIPLYIIILPTLLVVFVMRYLPMFGIVLAFKDYNGRLGFDSPWCGFENFVEIFKNEAYFKAIPNTLLLSICTLAVTFPAPIILAILVHELRNPAFKKTVQTISFIPHFLSWAAICGIINQLFDNYGFIWSICDTLGVEYTPIWLKASNFMPTYLLTSLWQGVGWGTIMYLATLVSISPELYEAAQIDGANRMQQIFNITLPSLLPITMMQLIMSSGGVLSSNFELIYGLRKTEWDTEVISTIVYKYGMGNGKGVSTALSLFQAAITVILTMTVNKIAKKVANISMW